MLLLLLVVLLLYEEKQADAGQAMVVVIQTNGRIVRKGKEQNLLLLIMKIVFLFAKLWTKQKWQARMNCFPLLPCVLGFPKKDPKSFLTGSYYTVRRFANTR